MRHEFDSDSLRLRWGLLLVWFLVSPLALGAEAVKISVPSGNSSPDLRSPVQTEVTFAAFDAGDPRERAAERAFWQQLIATSANGHDQGLEIFCVATTAVGPGACEEIRKNVAATKADNVTLESALVGSPESTPKTGEDSRYRTVYSLVRGCISGGTVFTTLVISKGLDPSQAILNALLAAKWSMGMQYWNDAYLRWMSSHGLIKKAASSTVYALMLHGGLVASGATDDPFSWEVARRVALTVGMSLFTGYYWQRLNQLWTDEAIEKSPENAGRYRKNSARGSLLQSVVTVAGESLNLTGSTLGSWMSGTIGATGVVTWLHQHRSGDWADLILRRRRRRGKGTDCAVGLELLVE